LRPDEDARQPAQEGEGALVLVLSAAGTAISPAQLKAFTIRPPGAPQGATLQSFCQIESTTALNAQPESADKRMISMRRLRESVQRDLGWLLNSASLDTTEDLTPFPEVAKSVVNYGMPSFAGTALHSIDPDVTARRIRESIETFEPRLSNVQVIVDGGEGENRDAMTLSFRIEGELWGQPLTQHVVLQTSIDVETGDVKVGEASG
jgi:type VI secretion system protein ImpF